MSNRNHHYYRKLYVDYFGPIPKDENGRTYDIHHRDGNSENNSRENLVALSIQEHYDIHMKQGDIGSCWAISTRMKLSPEEISKISREVNLLRVSSNNHNFQGEENSNKMRRIQNERVELGTHVFIGCNKKEKHPQYDHTIRMWRNKVSGEIVNMTNYELRKIYNLKSGAVSRVVNGQGLKSTGGWELVK